MGSRKKKNWRSYRERNESGSEEDSSIEKEDREMIEFGPQFSYKVKSRHLSVDKFISVENHREMALPIDNSITSEKVSILDEKSDEKWTTPVKKVIYSLLVTF